MDASQGQQAIVTADGTVATASMQPVTQVIQIPIAQMGGQQVIMDPNSGMGVAGQHQQMITLQSDNGQIIHLPIHIQPAQASGNQMIMMVQQPNAGQTQAATAASSTNTAAVATTTAPSTTPQPAQQQPAQVQQPQAPPSRPESAAPQTVEPPPLAPAGEEEPLYVNAKQYNRILKRRAARARLEASGRIPKERKKYLHESRHRHAMNRARGAGGRFYSNVNTDEQPPPPPPSSSSKSKSRSGGSQQSTAQLQQVQVVPPGATILQLAPAGADGQPQLVQMQAIPAQTDSNKSVPLQFPLKVEQTTEDHSLTTLVTVSPSTTVSASAPLSVN